MPELPEVETTARGIAPWTEGQRITGIVVRQSSLRWPVPATLAQTLKAQVIRKVSRRGKYLLLQTDKGHVLIHLGMSGSLRIVDSKETVRKHDHVDFCLASKQTLRFHDPRRFGCVLWHSGDLALHPLLADLGPEPLAEEFSDDYLFLRSRKRKVPIKQFIMDSHIVVGVGNIYANEALFMAGILPTRLAGSVSKKRYTLLVQAIKQVLSAAIVSGGTTLRDFVGGDGKPGYFKQQLHVYGRAEQECVKCGTSLIEIRQGQRSTVYCSRCQS